MTQLSHGDGAASGSRGAKQLADGEDDDDDEVSQGHRSNSNRTPPPSSSKRDGVRLSVTSPPPAFANAAAGALSPPSASASVISPFGSPSGWISSGQEEPVAGAVAATDKTSNVHINGDHVTQVRVDAIVLTPESSSGSRRKQGPDAASESAVDDVDEKEKEEDRDQSELLVSTRLAVSNSKVTGRDQQQQQLHVTAVQVEHTSNAHEETT